MVYTICTVNVTKKAEQESISLNKSTTDLLILIMIKGIILIMLVVRFRLFTGE